MKELLIDQYFRLVNEYSKEYGEKTIVLMQVGAFFEVYGKKHTLFNGSIKGSQLEEFTKICELNIAQKSKVSVKHTIQENNITKTINCNVVMAGFRDYILEKYLDKINNAGYTCVVYNQNENDTTKRELLGIFSPGTYFKQNEEQLTNNIMCISIFHEKPNKILKHNKFHYGISCIDILTGTTNVSEYNEPYYKSLTTFDELEKYYSVYKPNEIMFLFHSSNMKKEEIEHIIKYIDINSKIIRIIDLNDENNPLSIRANRCSEQLRQNEIIKKYYSNNKNEYDLIMSSLFEYQCATHSFCFLLDYINKQNTDLVKRMKAPVINHHNDTMILANHSLKQLNIIQDNNSKGKLSSVLNFLNIAVTPMGKREIKNKIVKPITNEITLNKEYERIDYVLQHYNDFEFIRRDFHHLKDIESMYRKIAIHKITPYDIFLLNDTIHIIKTAFNKIRNLDNIDKYSFYENEQLKTCFQSLIQFIKKHFTIKKCESSFNDIYGHNIFVRGLYPDIDEYERKSIESYDKLVSIQQFLSNQVKKNENKPKKTDYCNIHQTEKSGLFLKMTDTRAKKLVESFKHIGETMELSYKSSYDGIEKSFTLNIQDIKREKRGSDTQITSKLIRTICSLIDENINNMKKKVKEMFFTVMEELLYYQEQFQTIVSFVVSLDVSITKAYLAKKYNYCKPTIYGYENMNESNNMNKNEKDIESFIEAKNMRHLLIEHLNTDEIYIPNDVSLNNDERGFLLFGTNAVGKSSLIKSVGICLILAQSGFYVPCSSFYYKPFKYIFTRILGNDNIFKGQSTFAVEMSELRTILRHSDKNSLVLGDELCSGTELGSAISIFVAGLQQLHERKSKFIFATHFHEVTHMEEVTLLKHMSLKHMSVYYDAEVDKLIYDRLLRDGPGNNMYGLEVCKALNLPTDFVDLAFLIRNKYNEEEKPVSILEPCHFNSKKLKDVCELCGKKSSDVHHLQYQKNADENNMIGHFHKNHKANLMNICESCHNEIHRKNKEYIRRTTPNGNILIEK